MNTLLRGLLILEKGSKTNQSINFVHHPSWAFACRSVVFGIPGKSKKKSNNRNSGFPARA